MKLTLRHEGPEMRTMAIPALPGAVESAYIVSSESAGISIALE